MPTKKRLEKDESHTVEISRLFKDVIEANEARYDVAEHGAFLRRFEDGLRASREIGRRRQKKSAAHAN